MITTMHSDQNASPPRVEVITSVQRRRRWPTAEKIRLVEETMQPGMSVSYVARRVSSTLCAPTMSAPPGGNYCGGSPNSMPTDMKLKKSWLLGAKKPRG